MDFYWDHETFGVSAVLYVAPGQKVKADGRRILPIEEHPSIIEEHRVDSLPPASVHARKNTESPVSKNCLAVYLTLKENGAATSYDVADILSLRQRNVENIIYFNPDIFVKVGTTKEKKTRKGGSDRNIFDVRPGVENLEKLRLALQDGPSRTSAILDSIKNILSDGKELSTTDIIMQLAQMGMAAESYCLHNSLGRHKATFAKRIIDRRAYWKLIKS